MSYDTGYKKEKKNSNVDELQESLIANEFKQTCAAIETQLSNFQYKLKELEKILDIIGSDKDNEQFRVQTRENLQRGVQMMQVVSNEIKQFDKFKISSNQQKEKDEKLRAFKMKLDELTNKFQLISKKIYEKEQLYIELAQKRQSFRNQSSYVKDKNNLEDQEQALIQKQKNNEQIQIIAEADYMDNVIQERQQQINQIENIFKNINTIAQDLALETTSQGQKLQKLDENVTVARDNAKEGLNQLNQAAHHQKKGGKCLFIILGIIILFVVIIVLVFLGVNGKL